MGHKTSGHLYTTKNVQPCGQSGLNLALLSFWTRMLLGMESILSLVTHLISFRVVRRGWFAWFPIFSDLARNLLFVSLSATFGWTWLDPKVENLTARYPHQVSSLRASKYHPRIARSTWSPFQQPFILNIVIYRISWTWKTLNNQIMTDIASRTCSLLLTLMKWGCELKNWMQNSGRLQAKSKRANS